MKAIVILCNYQNALRYNLVLCTSKSSLKFTLQLPEEPEVCVENTLSKSILVVLVATASSKCSIVGLVWKMATCGASVMIDMYIMHTSLDLVPDYLRGKIQFERLTSTC